MRMLVTAAALCLATALSPPTALAAQVETAGSPQAAVDGLLAADRAFSAASSATDLVSGLAAMFDAGVVMPLLQTASFATGKGEVVEALRANPANAAARAEWTPVRGGISADGQHGFTFGYMTVTESDKPARQFKYLSYWVKRPEGWRVAVYRRVPRPAGEVSLSPMAPALPARLVVPTTDQATLAAHRQSLDAAERAFSDEAQVIGIGPAFQKNGSGDAMNMGNAAQFTIGADAIGQMIAAGPPAKLTWAPDDLLVASSGDLGVTWGLIRINGPVPAGRPNAIPFFTVWRRASSDDRWLYVAE